MVGTTSRELPLSEVAAGGYFWYKPRALDHPVLFYRLDPDYTRKRIAVVHYGTDDLGYLPEDTLVLLGAKGGEHDS